MLIGKGKLSFTLHIMQNKSSHSHKDVRIKCIISYRIYSL